MQPDRHQIEIFVDGLFRNASPKGFVSLRAFYEEDAPIETLRKALLRDGWGNAPLGRALDIIDGGSS